MNKIIGDAVAFGLRLKNCSDATLVTFGIELVALGNQLDDACRTFQSQRVSMVRAQLCSLARRVAENLEKSVGVVFNSVSPTNEPTQSWLPFFGTADVTPVPLRPEQLKWLAEAACAA